MAVTANGVYISDEIEAHLAKKLEGGLFVEFFMIAAFGTWTIHKHFYTVENGIVYEVGNGRHGRTKDTMLEIEAGCYRLGDYDPAQTYEIKIREFSLKAMDRLMR